MFKDWVHGGLTIVEGCLGIFRVYVKEDSVVKTGKLEVGDNLSK